VCPRLDTPVFIGGVEMENKRKTLTPTEKRIVRLEDGFLTLVQLNRILSGEADELRNRLEHLESVKPYALGVLKNG
jgi:hypothetical protein